MSGCGVRQHRGKPGLSGVVPPRDEPVDHRGLHGLRDLRCWAEGARAMVTPATPGYHRAAGRRSGSRRRLKWVRLRCQLAGQTPRDGAPPLGRRWSGCAPRWSHGGQPHRPARRRLLAGTHVHAPVTARCPLHPLTAATSSPPTGRRAMMRPASSYRTFCLRQTVQPHVGIGTAVQPPTRRLSTTSQVLADAATTWLWRCRRSPGDLIRSNLPDRVDAPSTVRRWITEARPRLLDWPFAASTQARRLGHLPADLGNVQVIVPTGEFPGAACGTRSVGDPSLRASTPCSRADLGSVSSAASAGRRWTRSGLPDTKVQLSTAWGRALQPIKRSILS